MPQSSTVGVIVSELPSGDARTVTTTVTDGATGCSGPRSWMVIVTSVSAATLFGEQARRVRPATSCATGRTPEFDEKARKGPAPPVIVRVDRHAPE